MKMPYPSRMWESNSERQKYLWPVTPLVSVLPSTPSSTSWYAVAYRASVRTMRCNGSMNSDAWLVTS